MARQQFKSARYRTVSPGGTTRNHKTLEAAHRAGGSGLGWRIEKAVEAEDGTVAYFEPLRSGWTDSRSNPPSGWIPASAVKVERLKGGAVKVHIRRVAKR